ncbi:amino acid permease [Clostridium pasteurianum]|uniref:Amino acid permease n=1 Tax=Clostridium pasteurianum BC1 TaxID=86416 RepID=R4K686_CLOPA|nr:amino acid permease [Clostridium pasteurianum]AGK98048.1 Amino acid permease [Clostridium pasteurianum BC1]
MKGFSWNTMIPVIILIVILLAAYNMLKVFVFDKIRAVKWAKWVVLVITILLGALNAYAMNKFGETSWQYYICMGLFVIALFTFFDLLGFGKKRTDSKYNKKDDVVIRPKAKPNRVKDKSKNNQ